MLKTLSALFLTVCCGSAAFAVDAPRQPGVPTLWLVGDSTVRVNGNGQKGWGDPFIAMFDPAKVRVINRAIGGRSSRTFITEGRWDAILKEAEKGDVVLIQLGHNDAGPLSGDNRERGSIRGTGDETKDVTLTLGDNKDKPYTVHTYGWYITKYVKDAQAKGMTPVVLSPVPRCPKPTDKYDPQPKPAGYRLWSQQAAETAGAKFIDLQQIIWKTYAGRGSDELKKAYFTDADYTHTSPAGATHNAQCVVEGLKRMEDFPLIDALKLQEAPEKQPVH